MAVDRMTGRQSYPSQCAIRNCNVTSWVASNGWPHLYQIDEKQVVTLPWIVLWVPDTRNDAIRRERVPPVLGIDMKCIPPSLDVRKNIVDQRI